MQRSTPLSWQQAATVQNNNFRIDTKEFSAATDATGQLTLNAAQAPQDLQWLFTITTKDGAGGKGRFAFLGYSGVFGTTKYQSGPIDYQYRPAQGVCR